MNIVEHVIEIYNVYVVRDQGLCADFDVKIAVDGAVSPEDTFVTDTQVSLVAADPAVVAEVHPAAQHDPPVAGAPLEDHILPEKNETLGHYLRIP